MGESCKRERRRYKGFQMMTTGEVWNPTDLFKVDMPESLKEKQLSKAVKQATKFLEKQGLTVT